eukprot:TRINITY_DN5531_c0_g1_i2.p1 TRINITY_DN5531_c0_g1~~TRINITY_DN5531_c0_g1_i2.p1  ORF type:complete len:244 (-),score=20.72 TRINITY_DN5531_c0_g1_i2:28-759(-)
MSLKSCLSVSSSKKRNPSSSSSKSVNTVNISSSSSGETKENTSKSKSATKVSSKSEPQKTLSRSSSRTFGTTLQQQSKLDSKLIERDVRKAEKISSKNVPPKSIPTKPIIATPRSTLPVKSSAPPKPPAPISSVPSRSKSLVRTMATSVTDKSALSSGKSINKVAETKSTEFKDLGRASKGASLETKPSVPALVTQRPSVELIRANRLVDLELREILAFALLAESKSEVPIIEPRVHEIHVRA